MVHHMHKWDIMCIISLIRITICITVTPYVVLMGHHMLYKWDTICNERDTICINETPLHMN